jgi:hypothetical protein
MTTANNAGFSLERIILDGSRAKAIHHQDGTCHSHTVIVAHDVRHGGVIETVTCSLCATPQRCAAPSADGTHGRLANVLTPAGWRCFECAAAAGFWHEERDSLMELLVGWD